MPNGAGELIGDFMCGLLFHSCITIHLSNEVAIRNNAVAMTQAAVLNNQMAIQGMQMQQMQMQQMAYMQQNPMVAPGAAPYAQPGMMAPPTMIQQGVPMQPGMVGQPKQF
jgi:hypothetical protein